MHKIDLFELARTTLEERMCRQISDEEFVYQAFCHAEVRQRVEFKVMYAIDDLLEHDRLVDELEDYILDILSADNQKTPEPQRSFVRNYYSQW